MLAPLRRSALLLATFALAACSAAPSDPTEPAPDAGGLVDAAASSDGSAGPTSPPVAPDGGAAPSPPPDFKALDAYLDARLAAGINGFAMQIYDAQDKLVYQRGSGTCANQPMCPAGSPPFTVDLVTGIASSSKWVTSTTVLAVLDGLVEGGKAASLDAALDTKVAPILACPGVTGPVTDITMRQLLSFTSGVIPDHECVNTKAATLRSCACDVLRDSTLAMVDSPTAGTPRKSAHPPGTTYKYGASHHAVAGAVVEAITGKSYAAVFSEKVAKPLGLSMTYKSDTNLAGTIDASVADYAKFLGAMFHDGQGHTPKRVISKEAAEQQRRAQVGPQVVQLITSQADAVYGLNTWRWCTMPFDASAIAAPPKVTIDPTCTHVFQQGHGGKGGYLPFLDVGGRYYAVYAMREVSPGTGADYSPEEVAISANVRYLTHLAMTTGGK
jgi:serine-type D-Ala-D-Ala carboxypeptidase/endopeptidase